MRTSDDQKKILDDLRVKINAIYLTVCSPVTTSRGIPGLPALPLESEEQFDQCEEFVKSKEKHKLAIVSTALQSRFHVVATFKNYFLF